MFNNKKLFLASGLLVLAGSVNAAYEIKLSDEDKITFGGYIQGDIRFIDGNASSTLVNDDFWIGHAVNEDISNVRFSADSTRFNTKYVHGDLTGFIEMDFFGGGGNEKLTNSSHPRLRHAFIKYKNFCIYWQLLRMAVHVSPGSKWDRTPSQGDLSGCPWGPHRVEFGH